jgi:hypothetical protein
MLVCLGMLAAGFEPGWDIDLCIAAPFENITFLFGDKVARQKQLVVCFLQAVDLLLGYELQ